VQDIADTINAAIGGGAPRGKFTNGNPALRRAPAPAAPAMANDIGHQQAPDPDRPMVN